MAKTIKMRLMTMLSALSLVSFGTVFSHNFFRETTKVAYADGVTFNEISDPSDFITENIGECTFADAKQWVVDHWNDVEDIIRNDDCWVGVYFHVSGNLHWIKVTDSQIEEGKQAFIDSFDEDKTTSLSELQTLWDEDYFKYVYFCNPSSSGGGESHTHDEKTFTAWESNDSLPTVSGSYYLTQHVTLTGSDFFQLSNLNIDLCLNGYSIVLSGYDGMSLTSGTTLNLYDCNGSNSTWYVTSNGYYEYQSTSETPSEGALEVVGGFVTGANNPSYALFNVYDNSTLNMYAGTLCYSKHAVLANGLNSNFYMYDGRLTHNRGGDYGGAVNVVNGGRFTMHDGLIDHNRVTNHGSAVYVRTNSLFTMNAGTISDNGYISESNQWTGSGGAVGIEEGGTFIMNDGLITNNRCVSFGGAVRNNGVFTMNGGAITNNYCRSNGGAISSGNTNYSTGAALSINGDCTITDNLAYDSAGGIYWTSGEFHLSGSNEINNNKAEEYTNAAKPSNIYINDYDSFNQTYILNKIKIDAPLTNDEPMGITVKTRADKPNTFTEDGKSAYLNKFVSDDPNYVVAADDNGALYLIAHQHNWSYVADGVKITASCANSNCTVTSGLELELQAPANLLYDGTAKEATFKEGFSYIPFPNPQIKYYQGESEVTSCIDAGSYTAKVTFGDATASIDFEITKVTPTPTAVSDRNATYGQSLSEIDLPDGWAWNSPTDKVGNVGTRQHKATFTPEDSVNYKTVEQDVNVIVTKANPNYTVPTGLTALINKTLSTVTLPSGWSWDNPNENVGDVVGNKVFKATFTPEDTDNYNLVEHVDITVQVVDHEHNWSYTANGASITASCGGEDCPVTEGLTITLEAPSGDMHYDGNARLATLKAGYSEEAFPDIVVKYFQGSNEVNECVNVGKYTAKMTVGNATASVEFEILANSIIDPNTSEVSVEVEDAAVPDNVELRVEVRADVKEKDIPEQYNIIVKKLAEDEEIAKVYDVRLIQKVGDVETEIQPSDLKPGLKLKVHMAIPEGLDVANMRILHIHSLEDMEFVSDYTKVGNDLVFEISKLSQFAFIKKSGGQPTPAAKAGLPAGAIVGIVIGSILLVCLIAFLLLFFVFAKFIIVKEKEEEKVVRAIKIGSDKKDDIDYYWMMTFKFRRELKPYNEVFNNKQDAEEFLKNHKGQEEQPSEDK